MEFVCDATKNTACEQNTCLCDVELANAVIRHLEGRLYNAYFEYFLMVFIYFREIFLTLTKGLRGKQLKQQWL